MAFRLFLPVAAACALASAPLAHGSTPKRPPVTWIRGDGSYTKASRGLHSIKLIVIHATDGGTLGGNVWWLSGGHSHASSHYVIARDGSIVQLVHLSDIAWHAGNGAVNRHSVGIEHVGETYDPSGFTASQYDSSARLVAWLVRRYGIPIDGKHIIGHSDVPDPKHPSLRGGFAHHTDPGPYWRWGYYLGLVRHYAFPELYGLHVDTTTIDRDELLTGIVPWRVRTKGGRASRVDFLVDGRITWSDSRKPFAFAGGRGWNTTQVENGVHVLTVRASGDGLTAAQRLVVRVVNRDFALTTSALHAWQRVHGFVRVHAKVRGARTTGIGLYVDGRIISRDRRAPYHLRWNSRRVHDGRHVITLAAVSTDGRIAKRRLPLIVKNHLRPKRRPKPAPKPKPKPAPKPAPKPVAPAVVSQSLANGQTVSGTVLWQVETRGPVVRVEFLVDNVSVATATTEPWTTAWDTSTLAPGDHTVSVRAVTADGRSASASAIVSVAAP